MSSGKMSSRSATASRSAGSSTSRSSPARRPRARAVSGRRSVKLRKRGHESRRCVDIAAVAKPCRLIPHRGDAALAPDGKGLAPEEAKEGERRQRRRARRRGRRARHSGRRARRCPARSPSRGRSAPIRKARKPECRRSSSKRRRGASRRLRGSGRSSSPARAASSDRSGAIATAPRRGSASVEKGSFSASRRRKARGRFDAIRCLLGACRPQSASRQAVPDQELQGAIETDMGSATRLPQLVFPEERRAKAHETQVEPGFSVERGLGILAANRRGRSPLPPCRRIPARRSSRRPRGCRRRPARMERPSRTVASWVERNAASASTWVLAPLSWERRKARSTRSPRIA